MSPFSPRRCRRTDRCARAPRQLPRRADDYRVQPSTPPPNTSQPPYRPAGHGRPKGSPERHGGPKGFGHGGPLVQLCSVYRPCGRWLSLCPRCLGRVAVRVLGVVPSGLSPRGVASFYTLGWGSGDPRGNGLQSPPVPAPHLFPVYSVVPRVPSPRGVETAFLAGSHGAFSPLVVLGFEHGGWRRKCVVRSRGFGGFGLGRRGVQ